MVGKWVETMEVGGRGIRGCFIRFLGSMNILFELVGWLLGKKYSYVNIIC